MRRRKWWLDNDFNPDLYRYMLQFGRVLFLSDGLKVRGEYTGDANFVYLGTGSGTVTSLFGRNIISPSVVDWAVGTNFSGTASQRLARYSVSVGNTPIWSPDTDGFTCFSVVIGQYYPGGSGGPNTRRLESLQLIDANVDTPIAAGWIAGSFAMGQVSDSPSGYQMQTTSIGPNGFYAHSGQDIESWFNIQNGAWSSNALGPFLWGFGCYKTPGSNVYQTFYSNNSGVLTFDTSQTTVLPSIITTPANPVFSWPFGGYPGLTQPHGSNAGAQGAVHAILPYVLAQDKMQATFNAIWRGLAIR